MSDLVSLQDKLEKARAEAQKLEAQIEEQRAKLFTDLPKQVGLESVDDLIKALVEHASPRLKGTLRAALAGGAPQRSQPRARRAESGGAEATGASAGRSAGQRRTRATITDETRAAVKRLVGEGKTGAEIAQAVGISLPSVQNIKKALGLVRQAGK